MKYRCCNCHEEFEIPPTCEKCWNDINVGEMVCDSFHHHFCSIECFSEDFETELEEIKDDED